MGNQSHRVPVSEIRAAVLDDTRAKIAAHGWTVIGGFPTPEDPGPSFAYTVGLSGKGLPEVAIYGLHTRSRTACSTRWLAAWSCRARRCGAVTGSRACWSTTFRWW